MNIIGKTVRPDDEMILAVINSRSGIRTGAIARALGGTCWRPYILRRLKKMEADGLVQRHPIYTYPTDIYWELPK